MRYEYKSIVLSDDLNSRLTEKQNQILNEYFKEGWEFVDSISQSFSVAQSGFKGFGSVLVVLKRSV